MSGTSNNKKESRLLAYGLRNGVLVHISEIDRGLERGEKCNCICPNPRCKGTLVARLGDTNIDHFSHKPNTSICAKGAETGVHLKAKEILCKTLRVALPELIVRESRSIAGRAVMEEEVVVEETPVFALDKAVPEYREDDFVPDISAWKANKQLYIEIAVSHFVDDEKKKKIETRNTSCIEIDLSHISRMATPREIEHHLNDVSNIHWIHHAGRHDALNRVHERILKQVKKSEQQEAERRKAELEEERRKQQYRVEQSVIEGRITDAVVAYIKRHGAIRIPPLYKHEKQLVRFIARYEIDAIDSADRDNRHDAYVVKRDRRLCLAFFFGKTLFEQRYRRLRRREEPAIGLSLEGLKSLYRLNGDITDGDIETHLFGRSQRGGFWIYHPKFTQPVESKRVSIPRSSLPPPPERTQAETDLVDESIALEKRARSLSAEIDKRKCWIKERRAIASPSPIEQWQIDGSINIRAVRASLVNEQIAPYRKILETPSRFDWAFNIHPDALRYLIICYVKYMHEKPDDDFETITCGLLCEYIKSLGISYSDVVLDMLEIYEKSTIYPASIPIYLPSFFIPETRIYKLIEVFVDSFLKDLQTRHVLSRRAVPGGGTEAWYEVARPEFFQYAGQAELPDRVS